MLIDHSDEEIAHLVQQGNIRAFGVIVDRYEAKLRRYASKFLFGYEDAQDHVQDVFLKAYTHIQGFDTKRRFSPWIYRIAHNTFINAIKRNGKETVPFFNPDELFPHPVAKEETDSDALHQELKEALEQCLDKLDPKYREPLVLSFFEELSYKEIADVLRIPTSTVGVRIRRAKQQLRTHYQQSL